jgi:hypothetical protein
MLYNPNPGIRHGKMIEITKAQEEADAICAEPDYRLFPKN